ncbi:MAG: phosphoribosyltransferase [Halodesulfurarchaeum sp.]
MTAGRRFKDREAAGRELGEQLGELDLGVDIVLAVPRGGLPLGRAVADALGVALDVVVASKIGAPNNPEYAVGAVASDGSLWRNESAIARTGLEEAYFERERKREAENAREKAQTYRKGRAPPDLSGRTVAVVDDGVATGSTVRACLAMLSNSDVEEIVLAVPVGPPETIAALEEAADEVVCLERPRSFMGVGQFYTRFDQVREEEAMEYLG